MHCSYAPISTKEVKLALWGIRTGKNTSMRVLLLRFFVNIVRANYFSFRENHISLNVFGSTLAPHSHR